jgi:aryl sulfotransferase
VPISSFASAPDRAAAQLAGRDRRSHYRCGVGESLKRYQSMVSDSARWESFEHRPGDIIISTPPKCGTTLVQMMCALLIFDGPDFPARLDDLSPWLDMNTRSDDEVLAQVAAMTHRRFLKTHTPLDGIPEWDDVTYVVVGRDPRDVFVSWEHHSANVDPERFVAVVDESVGIDKVAPFLGERPTTMEARLDRWLVDDSPTATMSLAVVAGHLDVAWRRRARNNVLLFHFEDLRDDRAGSMRRLAEGIGLGVAPARLAELAASASLDRMRSRAEDLAPNTKSIFADSTRFFRSGDSGEGRAIMTPAQEAVYDQRIGGLVAPELRDWLHRTS